jgi:signal transduction histidine kinase
MRQYHGKKMVGWTALVGIGSGLALAYSFVFWFLQSPLLVGVALPAILAIGVIFIAVWLWWRDSSDDRVYRMGIWCSTITVFAAALGLINIFSEWMVGGQVQSSMIMIANSATVGAVLGILVGYYDSARQEQMQKIEDQRFHIQHLNERLTVLNRILRHDIQNDINVVEGYASLAKEDRMSTTEALEVIQGKAQEIAAASTRARQIEKLLHKNSIDDEVDLVEITRAEVQELEEGYSGDLDISLESPDRAIVKGNPLFRSMLNNLLENAVEHADTGAVKIDLDITEDGEGYRLEVRDNGPGLPASEIQLLESQNIDDFEQSAGTGLWLINWIVNEFDGDIEATNTGAGTCISLWLPKPDDEPNSTETEITEVDIYQTQAAKDV